MENIKACIVCLEMDLTLFSLHTNSLQQYYELLTGTDFTKKPELPMYVCFQCKAMLIKFYTFRQKSFRGQAVLQSILQSYGKITIDKIKQVDTTRYLLNSNLSIVSAYSINLISEDIVGNAVKVERDEKCEYELSYSNSSTKVEKVDDFDDLDDDWFSDDEPLSLHKRRKSKDQESLENEDTVKIEIEVETAKAIKVKKPKRTKKIRPTKNLKRQSVLPIINKPEGVADDMPLETYVTIVKLSEKDQHEEIIKRRESQNYQNANFKCDLCYKGFLDTLTWKHHMKKHDKASGNVICKICKLRFKTARGLKKHMFGHTRKFICNYCPYVSRNCTQAKHHLHWHQGVMYKCPYCEEMLSKWTSYLSHVRIKHPSDHICGFCGYSFVSQLGLAMHKTLMHKDLTENEDDKDLPYCELCDVKFANEEAFKRHMVTAKKHTETSDNKKGCRSCGSSFNTEEELRWHSRECSQVRRSRKCTRPDGRKWPAKCAHCPEVMASARAYWGHFRRAHPDKEYPSHKAHICDVCGKGFRGNAFLLYHKNTHSNVKTFSCTECGKAFYNRANLNTHLKTHSERRPYVCCVCAKGFKSKGALDRHFRSHTGDKPYKCEVCGKAFGQSNSCKLHVRTVHLKQPSPYVSRARQQRRRSPTATHT